MFTALIIKINLIYYWRRSIIFIVKEKQKLITFINSNSHIIYSFFVRFNLTHGVWQYTFINIHTFNWFMVHCCKKHTNPLFSTFPVQTRSKKPVSVLVSAKGIFLFNTLWFANIKITWLAFGLNISLLPITSCWPVNRMHCCQSIFTLYVTCIIRVKN